MIYQLSQTPNSGILMFILVVVFCHLLNNFHDLVQKIKNYPNNIEFLEDEILEDNIWSRKYNRNTAKIRKQTT